MKQSAAQDEPVAADEFLSADELDRDVKADDVAQQAMELALERLRGRHLAFRAPEKHEAGELDELRLKILTAATESSAIEDYYQEAWRTPSDPTRSSPVTKPHEVRRIAVMQLELMRRAFHVLRLHLFANAPDNHGWMALFRDWGRSPRFNDVFDELQATLEPEFATFYCLYIRHLPHRASLSGHLPIHHPWLRPEHAVGRGLYMDSGILEAELEIDVRPGAGGVVDQRGARGADQPFEKRSDEPPSDGGTKEPSS